jgi:pyridoxine/pyridoxamine 5'-phosphate oxidase
MEAKNLDIYGDPLIPWARPLSQLEAIAAKPYADPDDRPKTFWLGTVRPNGRPHLAGIGALWVDGKFYFTSGPGTRKSRNLAENPTCAISMALGDIDLIVEGRAAKVTDAATLERIAERFAAQGWPARATDGAITAEYSAPSAGPPPWHLYQVTPITAFGVATAKPYGATRWRFDATRS